MKHRKHGIGYARNYIRLHPNSYRNMIANTILSSLKANKDVSVIFLSGSTVHGGTDEFSDIDINVVVQNPQKFRRQLLKYIDSMSKVIHTFTPPDLDNILVIFLDDLTKIDVGIYSTQEFAQKKLCIKNKDAVIKGAINTIDTKPNHLSTVGESYLAMALADLIAIPREIKRNNMYEARANVDDARRHIAIYINLINNDMYFDFNNFCKYLNKKQIQLFQNSLHNNSEYVGILKSALLLLEFIKGLNVYKKHLIKTVEEHLKLNTFLE